MNRIIILELLLDTPNSFTSIVKVLKIRQGLRTMRVVALVSMYPLKIISAKVNGMPLSSSLDPIRRQ